MKEFLYRKMFAKGSKLLVKITVSFVVAFFASEQVAHNLEQIGVSVDPDQLGLALAGGLTAAMEMIGNFQKHEGSKRVAKDTQKVTQAVKKGTIATFQKLKLKKSNTP